MRLKKYGVDVRCESCKYVSNEKQGSFEVTVPLSDIETDLEGIARLMCSVTPKHHKVELKEWNDLSGQPLKPSKKIGERVFLTLALIEEHQICGNQAVCPSEVIQIVEKHNRN